MGQCFLNWFSGTPGKPILLLSLMSQLSDDFTKQSQTLDVWFRSVGKSKNVEPSWLLGLSTLEQTGLAGFKMILCLNRRALSQVQNPNGATLTKLSRWSDRCRRFHHQNQYVCCVLIWIIQNVSTVKSAFVWGLKLSSIIVSFVHVGSLEAWLSD